MTHYRSLGLRAFLVLMTLCFITACPDPHEDAAAVDNALEARAAALRSEIWLAAPDKEMDLEKLNSSLQELGADLQREQLISARYEDARLALDVLLRVRAERVGLEERGIEMRWLSEGVRHLDSKATHPTLGEALEAVQAHHRILEEYSHSQPPAQQLQLAYASQLRHLDAYVGFLSGYLHQLQKGFGLGLEVNRHRPLWLVHAESQKPQAPAKPEPAKPQPPKPEPAKPQPPKPEPKPDRSREIAEMHEKVRRDTAYLNAVSLDEAQRVNENAFNEMREHALKAQELFQQERIWTGRVTTLLAMVDWMGALRSARTRLQDGSGIFLFADRTLRQVEDNAVNEPALRRRLFLPSLETALIRMKEHGRSIQTLLSYRDHPLPPEAGPLRDKAEKYQANVRTFTGFMEQGFGQGYEENRQARFADVYAKRTSQRRPPPASQPRSSAEQKRVVFYQLIGLPTNQGVLPKSQVNTAYKKASLKAHPDKPGGSEAKMKALNKARDEYEAAFPGP